MEVIKEGKATTEQEAEGVTRRETKVKEVFGVREDEKT